MIEQRTNGRYNTEPTPVPEQKGRIEPSEEWAWMLGVLFASNRNLEGKQEIALQKNFPQLLYKFSALGTDLFGKKDFERKPIQLPSGELSEVVIFRNVTCTDAIGNLRTDQAIETMETKHQWIFREKRYIWKFLNGYFDLNGSPRIIAAHTFREILLRTRNIPVADFLTKHMKDVGIQNTRNVPDKQEKSGIRGIAIYNLHDIQLFANNIHSVVSRKEDMLEQLRNIKPLKIPIDAILNNLVRAYMTGSMVGTKKECEEKYRNRVFPHSSAIITRIGNGSYTAGRNIVNGIGGFVSAYLDTQKRGSASTQELTAIEHMIRNITQEGQHAYHDVLQKAGATFGEVSVFLALLQKHPERIFPGKVVEKDIRKVQARIVGSLQRLFSLRDGAEIEKSIDEIKSALSDHRNRLRTQRKTYFERKVAGPEEAEIWNFVIQNNVIATMIDKKDLSPEEADILADFFDGDIIREDLTEELVNRFTQKAANYF